MMIYVCETCNGTMVRVFMEAFRCNDCGRYESHPNWREDLEQLALDMDEQQELEEVEAEPQTGDAEALDQIASWLREPEWKVELIEEVALLVESTGRDVRTPDHLVYEDAAPMDEAEALRVAESIIDEAMRQEPPELVVVIGLPTPDDGGLEAFSAFMVLVRELLPDPGEVHREVDAGTCSYCGTQWPCAVEAGRTLIALIEEGTDEGERA